MTKKEKAREVRNFDIIIEVRGDDGSDGKIDTVKSRLWVRSPARNDELLEVGHDDYFAALVNALHHHWRQEQLQGHTPSLDVFADDVIDLLQRQEAQGEETIPERKNIQ